MMKHALMSTLLLCGTAALAAPAAPTEAPPRCPRIEGAPSITATRDRGATLVPTQGRMAPISYTRGLLAMSQPGLMLATVGAKVIRSLDGGCHWAPWLDLTRDTGGALLTLSAAGAQDAYAWSVNGTQLSTIFGSGSGSAATRTVPGSGMIGLGVDAADPQHLSFADGSGVVWDSADGGATWGQRGSVAASWAYAAAWSPSDMNHVVMGVVHDGAWVSRDGGASWVRATGFGAPGEAVNVFSVAVSPADPDRVWAMGLNLAEYDRGEPSGGRHIYRSDDGGLTFTPVVDQGNGITLINGPLLAPHPTQAGVLYFVFGMAFQNYGTDLYRYSDASGAVTLTHNRYDEIGAIAFAPRNPRLMYLGLNSEDVTGR